MKKNFDVSLISIYESFFIYINNEKYKIRVDAFKKRKTTNCKYFITNHIRPLNTIITNLWPSYSFLDEEKSNYTYAVNIPRP